MQETSILEDRAEAEMCLIEAMRITNDAIRRVHKSGLIVDANFLTMWNEGRPMPQISFATKDLPKDVI